MRSIGAGLLALLRREVMSFTYWGTVGYRISKSCSGLVCSTPKEVLNDNGNDFKDNVEGGNGRKRIPRRYRNDTVTTSVVHGC